MLAKFASKHASDGLVTFVTHKGFAVLFKNWGIPLPVILSCGMLAPGAE